MNRPFHTTLALICCLLACLVTAEFGPLAPRAVAQQRNADDNGDRPRDGRGGDGGGGRRWRRFREGGDDGGDRRRARRGRDGDNNNDNSDTDSSMGVANYARMLIRERDKNGNKVLDGDEIAQLRGRAAGADLNNDKVITAEELIARLSDRASLENVQAPTTAKNATTDDGKASSGTTAAGKPTRVYTGSAAVGTSKDEKADQRRTYRFTPPSERLEAGLPSWFRSRDRNHDGQVSMSEYSRLWSRRLVSEFREYDLNDDGVITPKEAAKRN